MTNGYTDIKNTDKMLIMGDNPAENNRIAKDYIVNYTNAAFIVKEGFKLPEDGLYSGFDATTQVYDKSTWNYEAGGNVGPIPSVTTKPAVAAATAAAAASGTSGAAHPANAAAKPAEKSAPKPGAGAGGGGAAKVAPTTMGAAAVPGAAGAPPPPSLPPNVAYDLSLQ